MRSQALRSIICAGVYLFAAVIVSTASFSAETVYDPHRSAQVEKNTLQTELYVLDNAYANSVRIELHPDNETEGMMYYMYNDAMSYENTSGMQYICADGKMYVKQAGSSTASETDFSEEAVTEDEMSVEAVTENDEEQNEELDTSKDEVPEGYLYWGVKTDQYLLNMPAETLEGSTGSSEGENGSFNMYTECYVSSGSASGSTLYTVTWYHSDGTFEQVNLLQGRSGKGTYRLTQNFLILRENNGSDQEHLNEYHYYVKDDVIYQTVYLKQSHVNMP